MLVDDTTSKLLMDKTDTFHPENIQSVLDLPHKVKSQKDLPPLVVYM